MDPKETNTVPGADVGAKTPFHLKLNDAFSAAAPYMTIALAGADMISGAIGGGVEGLVSNIPIVGSVAKSIFGKRAARRAARARAEQERFNSNTAQMKTMAANNLLETEELWGDTDANTFAAKDGGKVKTAKIWLNDGEVVYHPDGTVKHIPKKGRKTDSVLSEEPVGSYVFGGLINPRTGNKFQDDAKKLFKPTKGKADDRYDNAAVKGIAANALFNEQEMEKVAQGVTPKTKKLPKGANKVLAAVKGDEVGDDRINVEDLWDKMYGTNDIVYKRPNTLASTLAGISNLIDQRSILSKGVTPQEYHGNPYAGIATKLALRRPVTINKVLSDINQASRTSAYDIKMSGRSAASNALLRTALANTTQRNIMDAWNNEAQQAAEVNRNAAQLYASLGELDRAAIYKTDDINARRQAAYDNAWQQYGQNSYNLWKSIEDTYNKYNYDKASLQAMAPFWEHGNPNKITFGKSTKTGRKKMVIPTKTDMYDRVDQHDPYETYVA